MMERFARLGPAFALVVGLGVLSAAAAAPPRPPAKPKGTVNTEFFETKVRPVLAAQCYKCHGEAKQLGGLRLDTAEGVRKGGGRGPVLIAGKPDQSLLLQVLR